MQNKRMENSIRSLVNLYTVVIGAALSLAVAGAIDVNKGLTSISTVSILLFVAFLATLFPFFHGALRHLDDTYLENSASSMKTEALIIDFALLFLHALAFLVLSQLLKKPADFAWFLVAVLSIDVVWGVFAYFGSVSLGKFSAESRWSTINFFFVLGVLFYLIDQEIYFGTEAVSVKLAWLLAIACVCRSTIDYLWCRDLYFPK
jgi:hypothetical protein